MDGAVLTVRVAQGSHFVIGANSTWARVVKELAYTTGEGPGDTAVSMGIPVLIADLAAESHRWPGFANAALEIGVKAAFAFPLRIGDDPTGALALYRRQPGVLSASELADAACASTRGAPAICRRRRECSRVADTAVHNDRKSP